MPQGVGGQLPPPAPKKVFKMEVKELKSKGLKREFSITVSKDDLKDKKIRKLQDIASKAKIDGFRPGKVPTSHIEKLYGQSVMVEVIEEKVSEASQNVLKERYLKGNLPFENKISQKKSRIQRLKRFSKNFFFFALSCNFAISYRNR